MERTQVERVPTVNDLRVKLCYICREEEHHDNPEDPPRAWTHPCSCTLVAHESCLLQWIKSAQQDPSRQQNALKCPQCGAQYELESDNPLILRILNAINGVLSGMGKAATAFGLVTLLTSFGFSMYIVCTSYGAFAVKEFLGEEMFNVLLTDDPTKWPLHAFVHLPIIPFSLILSRTRLFDSLPVVPLLLAWTTSPGVRTAPASGGAGSLWALLGNTANGTQAGFYPALNWPPTPFMVTVLFPFVRTFYRRAIDQLTKLVMGSAHFDATGLARVRRIIWAIHENGPAPLHVRIGAQIEPIQGGDQGQAPREGADAPEDPAADAERTLRVTTSSVGRFVGGALLIPTISNRMGKLLFHLSKHSALLRVFLAIHKRPAAPLAPRIQMFNRPLDSQAGPLHQLSNGFLTWIQLLCSGSPTWNQHDPVWWRNTVGLGIFVFTKDCFRLLHLWLTKRELESRRVKSRSFAGVDLRELDLIQPASDTQMRNTQTHQDRLPVHAPQAPET
ncbi:hypothetical protein OH77DRAFT_1426410 [Trametes cingulata]|nr:hypothetical protein OH77DRAFT_1426410 [Trametes cingulata]